MITHDLGVIAETAQWVVVMYAGKVLESGRTLDIFDTPRHPYTQGLLRSVPVIGRRTSQGRTRLQEIPGVVPSLYDLPQGCAFNPRCPHTMEICRQKPPPLTKQTATHRASCWLLN
jgi:peptide/nickel transport system ATP-binding protein/oligopeptide transport system ATP-binding protein